MRYVEDLPRAEPNRRGTAAELIRDAVDAAPGPVTIVGLGPLTDLAKALGDRPSLVDHIDRALIMGGAFGVGGNTVDPASVPVAELNVWFDPVAAQSVLLSGIPVTLVPLDATNQVPLTPAGYDAMLSARGGRPAVAARLLARYVEANPFQGGQFHWVDLTVAALVNPDLLQTRPGAVTVDTAPGPGQGRTALTPNGAQVQVAVNADRTQFETLFYPALGLRVPRPFTPDAVITYDGKNCEYNGPDPLPAQLTVRISNTSGHTPLGVSVGVYAPGTTTRDLAAYARSNPTGPPPFYALAEIAPLTAHTTSYWAFTNLSDATIICVLSLGRGTELAGHRAPAPH